MANDINWNLLLIVGGVGIGGYFLYKSGFLQNIGTSTSTLSKAVDTTASNVSSIPNTAINDLTNAITGFEANISTFENQIGSNINNITTIPNNILSSITGTISSLINSSKNNNLNTQTLQPSYVPVPGTPGTSSPGGTPTALGQQFLNDVGITQPISQTVSNINQSKSSSSSEYTAKGSSPNPNAARYSLLGIKT